MKRFFLLPLVALLMLMAFSPSATALAASSQRTSRMQQNQMQTRRVPGIPRLPTVTCFQNGCNNQNPINTGCSADATTVLSGSVFNGSGQRIGTIELRWSATCGTNWARVTSSIGSVALDANVARESGVDGPAIGACIHPACTDPDGVTATSAFTLMVWAPDVSAKALGIIVQGNQDFFGCVTQDPTNLPC